MRLRKKVEKRQKSLSDSWNSINLCVIAATKMMRVITAYEFWRKWLKFFQIS
jgi:hypothetical protein